MYSTGDANGQAAPDRSNWPGNDEKRQAEGGEADGMFARGEDGVMVRRF